MKRKTLYLVQTEPDGLVKYFKKKICLGKVQHPTQPLLLLRVTNDYVNGWSTFERRKVDPDG